MERGRRKSLEEVHGTIETSGKKSPWKRLLAFLGPAYLVSVGYMDPGNWATDIAGGSLFGYKLIWVLLMSNIMALLLQSLCARLGVVRGRDLAQAAALQLGGKDAEYTLIHIVETPGAMIYGDEIDDYETESDEAFLNTYKEKLEAKGFKVSVELGFGSPKKSIPKIVNASDFDLLVLGGHGHTGLKDLLFGTTVDSVRHRVKIPIYIV